MTNLCYEFNQGCNNAMPAVTRFSGSNSNIGKRKSEKPCASSGSHSYFSIRTSNNPQGFSFSIFRSSPEKVKCESLYV